MGFDLEKRLASELHRLAEDSSGPETDRRAKDRLEQFRRIADELKARLLGGGVADHELLRGDASGRGAAEDASPGKRTAVERDVVQAAVDRASAALARFAKQAKRAGDAFATVPWSQRSTFDDFRASGLRDVLERLGDRKLRGATLASAERDIASRAGGPRSTTKPTAAGQAMWRVAERRAATLYRHAQEHGEVAGEDPVVDEALQRCGSGQPLPASVREQMERELGISLDRVRVHTDPVAAAAAKAVRASAFTVGEDIFFAERAYAPDTREGQKLLAHELTHVVQAYQGRTSGGGGGGGGISVSQPGESLEREADAVADRVDRFAERDSAPQPAAPTGKRRRVDDDVPVVRRPVGVRTAGRGADHVDARAPRARGSSGARGSSPALKAAAPVASAPSVSRGNVLMRRGEVPDSAAPPSSSRGERGPNGERGQQPKLQVQRDRAEEHSKRESNKSPASDIKAQGKDLAAKVTAAAKPGHNQLKQAVAHTKAAPAGKQAKHEGKAQAKAHKQHEKDAKKAHAEAKSHVQKKANQHDAPHHPHAKHDAGEGGGAVQFKKIDDWQKYMPEALPDQDERERKRILALVKKQVNDDRRESAQALAQLRNTQLAQARAVRGLAPGLQAQIKGAESSAIGKVNASESSQAAAVQSHIAGVQAQVRATAAQAKSQIASAHASALQAVNAAKQAATQKLTQAKTKALSDIDQSMAQELAAVAAQYAATRSTIVALGSAKAGEARGLGDSVSLPYDGEKLEAARKAAQDVANEYASAMPQEASKAADEVCKSQPEVEAQVRKIAADQKKAVEEAFTQSKQVVDQAAEQAKSAADQIKDQATSQVDSTSSTTVSQLAAVSSSQVAAIRQQAAGARSGIQRASASAQQAVTQSCAQAAAGIEKGVKGLVKGAKQIEAPNPEESRQQAREGIQQINQGAQQIAGGLQKSAAASGAQLGQQAATAASGMQQTATAAKTQASQMGSAAQQGMTQLAQGASQGLQQLAQNFQQSAEKIAESGDKAMSETAAKTQEAYTALNDQVRQNLDGAVNQIRSSFNEAVPTKETADILANAQKAADAVKPWWQKALAFVVSIVVAIVVTVVITALIVTTGPIGAILVGAAAGALGSVLGQMASNLVLGNGLMEGITWQTVALGALGGGIGAGFSQGVTAGARALASGSTRFAGAGTRVVTAMSAPGGGSLGGFAIKTGVGVTGDFVSDAASQLIVTGKYEFSMENLATSLVTNAVTSGRRYEGMQERFQAGIQARTGHVQVGGPNGIVSAHGPGSPTPSGGGSQVGASGPHPTGDGGAQTGGSHAGSGGAHPQGAHGGQPSAGQGAHGAPDGTHPTGGHAGEGPGTGQQGPGAGQDGRPSGQHADGDGSGRGADARGNDGRGADGRGNDGRGADGRGDGSGVDARGGDGRGNGRGADGDGRGRGADGDGRGRGADGDGRGRGADGRGADGDGHGRSADGRGADGDGHGRSADGRGADSDGHGRNADGSDADGQSARGHDGDQAHGDGPDGRGRDGDQNARGDGDGPDGRGRDGDGRGRDGDGPDGRGRDGDQNARGRDGDGPDGRGRDGDGHGRDGQNARGRDGDGHGRDGDGHGRDGGPDGGHDSHAHGDGAQGHGDGPNGRADDGAHADSEAASALSDLGYPNATRAKADQAANAIESGGRPPADSLRDTAANQQGLRDLAAIDADPNLTPESKANIRRDVANRVRGDEPTGNLHRDVTEARAREQARVDAERAQQAARGGDQQQAGAHPQDGANAHPQDGANAHPQDGSTPHPQDGANAHPQDGAHAQDGNARPQDGTTQDGNARPQDGTTQDGTQAHGDPNAAPQQGTQGNRQPLHEGGLADPKIKNGFSDQLGSIQRRWGRMSPQERQTQIRSALDQQMRRAGLPELEVEYVNLGSRNGELRFGDWRVAVNERLINDPHMTPEKMQQLANTILHEARHGEQWYMIARHMGGQGIDAPTIATRTGIPENVVRRALADQRPMTPEQANAARAYYDSIYGNNRAHREDVLQRLRDKPAEFDRARQEYDRINNDPASTYQQKLDAWNRMEHARQEAQRAYQDYRNLPEERDAWAVGDDTGDAFAFRNDGGFFRRAWNRLIGRPSAPPMSGSPPTAHGSSPDGPAHGDGPAPRADGQRAQEGDPSRPPAADRDGEPGFDVIRQDNDFASETNRKGQRKPHIDANGDLVPANPTGDATILQHVIGRSPAKDQSPYTSFMTVEAGVAKAFGAHEIRLDFHRLQADVAAGRVPGVEVVTPRDVQAHIAAEIQKVHPGTDIDAALAGGTPASIRDYVNRLGLSRTKQQQLMDRLMAMHNTRRDGEWLIKGVVPSRYFDGPTPTNRPGVGPSTGPAGSHRTSGGAPDPNAPAPHAADSSSAPRDASPTARDGSSTPSRPAHAEDGTSRPPMVEDPSNERRPTGPRNDGDKDISQQHLEGGTTDGAGRVVQLRNPERYAKFINDASPLHKAIDEHQRYEVIRDFPVREVYSAPGHQNLREPGKMLGMAEKMDKLNTGNIFDGAEPIKLNIFTEQVSGRVVVKSIEVTDGNHRLAAGLHSGKWTTIKDIPEQYLRIEVNGFDTHGRQNPRWIPLDVVKASRIPNNEWFEVPPDWGAKGPTAQVKGDVSSLDESIPQKYRGVTLDKVIEVSIARVEGGEHGSLHGQNHGNSDAPARPPSLENVPDDMPARPEEPQGATSSHPRNEQTAGDQANLQPRQQTKQPAPATAETPASGVRPEVEPGQRAQTVEPSKHADVTKWATPEDRKGVPSDVPLTRDELRNVLRSKYETIASYEGKQKIHHDPQNDPFADLIKRLEAEPPGSLAKNKEKAKAYLDEWMKISAEQEAKHGSEKDLRTLYNTVEQEDFPAWYQSLGQLPKEQQAKLGHMWREEWRIYVRDLMSDTSSKEVLYLRDRALSGHRYGPRFDALIQKHLNAPGNTGDETARLEHAYDAVIKSSMTSNKDVNKGITGSEKGINQADAAKMAGARDPTPPPQVDDVQAQNVRAPKTEQEQADARKLAASTDTLRGELADLNGKPIDAKLTKAPEGKRVLTQAPGDALISLPSDAIPANATADQALAKFKEEGIPRWGTLTENERTHESAFADHVEKHLDKIVEDFYKAAAGKGDKAETFTFEVDGAKKLYAAYGAGKEMSPSELQVRATANHALHPTAVAIARLAFLKRLDHLAALSPNDPLRQVFVTNGGCAAGKGSLFGVAESQLGSESKFGAVWDAAGEGDAGENAWILQAAKARGLKVTYGFVENNPMANYKGVLERALATGRIVDPITYARSYVRGQQNMKEFMNSPAYLEALASGQVQTFGVNAVERRKNPNDPNAGLLGDNGRIGAEDIPDAPDEVQVTQAAIKDFKQWLAQKKKDDPNFAYDMWLEGGGTNALKFDPQQGGGAGGNTYAGAVENTGAGDNTYGGPASAGTSSTSSSSSSSSSASSSSSSSGSGAAASAADFEVRGWTAGHNTRGGSGRTSGGRILVQSGGIRATANVRGLTPDAQRYSVGFVQTLHESTRRAIYESGPGVVADTWLATRGEMLDQRTDIRSPRPWYNYGVSLGGSTRHPTMTDNPGVAVPQWSPNRGLLARMEGSERFTTYLVAMVGNDASTIVYLGNVHWSVNWAGRFNAAMEYAGHNAFIGGAERSSDGGAVLQGAAANEGPDGSFIGGGSGVQTPRAATTSTTSTSSTGAGHAAASLYGAPATFAGPISDFAGFSVGYAAPEGLARTEAPRASANVSSGVQIQRQAVVTAGVAGAVAITPTVLVENQGADATAGQIKKKDFFAKIEPLIESAAKDVLGPLWAVAGCPYIKHYITLYQTKTAADVEKFARRMTGSRAPDAQQLIADIVRKAREGIAYWKETKQLPADIVAADPAAARAADAAAGNQPGGTPPIQRKADNEQPSSGKSKPREVMERLGEGTPLDSTTQARMEKAFGTSFSDVRIHDDAEGAAAAKDHSAIAFAVGNHIAFAPGKYQPGSVEGDALLAHELTHVLQQRGATANASKDVSEVGDATEKDADRGAANAVAQLHGEENAPGADKAEAKTSSDLQLQRCIGTLNEGEQQALEEMNGFWSQNTTFEGDPFRVKLWRYYPPKNGVGPPSLNAEVTYTGPDDASGEVISFIFRGDGTRQLAPKITTDADNDWRTLTVDPHGDGSRISTISHSVKYLDGWNPRSREHQFQPVYSGSSGGDPMSMKSTVVRSKDALPGTTANTPVSGAADANVEALRVDIAATTTKSWLDEILTNPQFALDASAAPWAGLKKKVDADAQKYTSNVVDAHDEALKLTRLGQVISRVRPMLRALGAASSKEAYLPDIANDCVELVRDVRDKYAAGIAASWDGAATAELNAADTAFNAVWFRISGLYMSSNKGVQALITNAGFAAQDVKNLKSGGRTLGIYPALEAAIGVPGNVSDLGPGQPAQPPIHDKHVEWQKIRDAFMRGETGSLGKVEKLVTDTQTLAGMAALLSAIEIFYNFRSELDGVVGTVADKAPFTTNYTKVCNKYIGKLEKIASGVEAKLQAGKKIDEVGKEAVAEFQGVCDDQFHTDVKDIQSRIKTVKVIEALGKVLAIIGIAALTGGAAGAAVGGALEGAGASAAVVATGEFAAEVVVFTIVSRAGNEAVFGKNDTSAGEDLITNALMFGFLKAAMAGYGRVFKAYSQTHKTAFAVGGALTGMVGLQVFAEIHHKLKTGKMMDWDERAVGIFQNAVMMVALALGGYLAKPKAERIRVKMLEFTLKNVPGAFEKLEGKLAGLKGEIEALQKGSGSKKDMEKLSQLLQKIEKLWNEQISVLAEAAKLEKGAKAEAAKEFQEQVASMVKEIAKLDLQLSAAGVEIDLGSDKSGNFYKPLSPGFVAFKAEGFEILKDYYKENGGTFTEVKGKEGLFVGKDKSGEIFFVKDDVANSFFDKPTPKAPTEAEAKANRLEAEKAKLQNKQRAAQLRKLLTPHIVDGHVTYKFGRVVNGTGLAAAMDANTLPGTPKGEVGRLEEIPDTIGLGTGQETFAKLGDTPIGQSAPEISGGGGWAEGASPADMTANHGDYTSAATVANSVALTQLKSGVPILDGAVLEISITPDGSWKVPDAKVRIKTKLADGTEVFIYSDATDIATGLGPPAELKQGQFNKGDPAKEAAYKATLMGDGRVVYGDTVGAQKGGEKVLVSGGSATGAWNAKIARSLGAVVDWIAREVTSAPRSEHGKRKAQQIQDDLNENKITPEQAKEQMKDLQAFDAASLPRNVQSADAAMNDAGITRSVKEIASMTPTEEIPGEQKGKVKVTFTDGTSGIYDQVVVSHGTALSAKGATPGALTLTAGIEMRPVEVDGQVVALESVNPPGAVRVVGAAMWSRQWIDGGFIVEPTAKAKYENALNNQAMNAPRDSPGNPLIYNTGRQIPAANKAIGGGPDTGGTGGVKGADVYSENLTYTPKKDGTSTTKVNKLSQGEVKDGLTVASKEKLAGKAGVKVAPGTVTEGGATMTLFVPVEGAKDVAVNVNLRIKKAGDLTAATTHGDDAGPARLELTRSGGVWNADIQISSSTKPADLPFVLRHELNEAAGLVRDNPGGPPKGGFTSQMDAALLKKGAAKGAKPTPHDVAGAIEIIELFNDWVKLDKAKSPEAPYRKGVLDRAMDAQGLQEPVEVAAKKKLLESQGAPPELVKGIGKGPWKAPKSWNGPAKKGEWLGERGNSGWVSTRPEVIRVVGAGPDGRSKPIIFKEGRIDLSAYVQEELTVKGLTGEHNTDMPIIRLAYAKKHKLAVGKSDSARRDAALEAMKEADDGYGGKGLAPHHAGGDKVQMVPKAVHKIQHTDTFDYSD